MTTALNSGSEASLPKSCQPTQSGFSLRAACVTTAAWLCMLGAGNALADGTEMLDSPSIPISTGSGVAINGVGTQQATPADLMLMVPAGATINQVLLYWGDRYPQGSSPDDMAVINGIPVAGNLIGGPTVAVGINNIESVAYRTDITALGVVVPGMNTITIGGLMQADGAGIVVIYDNGGEQGVIDLRDGADYANAARFPNDPILGAYEPQTYNFAPVAVDRMATMTIFGMDAQPARTDRWDIYVDDVLVAQGINEFVSNAGPQWDVKVVDFLIPAGASSVRVEIFSGPPNGKGNPDSMVWIGGFLDITAPDVPNIDIEKLTNGVDADNPASGDAPLIAPGDVVNWSYIVTNTGDQTLTNIVVTDDQGVAVTCPQDTLEPMESMICTASGLADDLTNTNFTTVPGLCGGIPDQPLYQNMGTATGQTLAGAFAEDMDASHYCNPQEPGISIEKSTNGIDADDPNAGDAPQIMAGGIVMWTYTVTNTGSIPLLNINVTDDQGVPVSCPMNTLAVGESMVCTATGLAANLNKTASTTVPGLCGAFPSTPLYENTGLATGESATGQLVQDTDLSHYCNPQEPGIEIEKSTNGVDADDPNAGDAPQVMPGSIVMWAYTVTNTGNTTLNDILVTDDQGVAVSCPMDTLAPGESMECTASGIAEDLNNTGTTTVIGLCGSFPNTPLYQNLGSATGISEAGDVVQDNDASHYCNPQEPAIDIEKFTNGVDADDANGADVPQIAPGDAVSWTYTVTNTGNTTLTGITVTDDQGVPVSCPMDILAPGESMVCTADGVADDLTTSGFTTVPGLCGGFPNVPVYENMGAATGETASGQFVQDDDASHYCNPQEPGLTIEKSTNGVDADDPNAGDAPQIMPGSPVSWQYVVTNTGSITLNNVMVADDQGVVVTCPMDTLAPGESMVCTADGIAEDLGTTGSTTVPGLCGTVPQSPLYQNMGLATGETTLGGFVEDADASHYCNPPAPAIDIEKATNGADADSPNQGDAPAIEPGDPVNWTYVVTNTGNTILTNVFVVDDQGVAVDCPQNVLAPGESMTCTASGVAEDLNDTGFTTVIGFCNGFPGTPMYQNLGLVSGFTPGGDVAQDTDPSHYCNPPMAGIDIEKLTNGVDADDPNADDAPRIMPGDVVSWSYIVTNTGNTVVGGITVTDDQGVIVTCPQDRLDPGESMVCTASGIAEDLNSTLFTTVPGICDGPAILYENIGKVRAKSVIGQRLEDEDPSHYCNPPAPAIDIEKATNGVDADDANAGDAPQIMPGDVVTWTYVVTNTGTTPLTNVTVTDDQGVAVTCPMDTLAVGASMICTASGLADDLTNTGATTVPGACDEDANVPLYENIGTVVGLSPTGVAVNDNDPSHYCNPQAPGINVEKSTNGVDADDPNAGDAPQIGPGDLVNWTYTVTNTGNTTLTGVTVTDDQGVAVTCPMDTLDPGESMVCTASGLADDLLSTGFTTVPGLCGSVPNTPLYENMGTATGQSSTGGFVEDVDASHYCNPQTPTIDIEKSTNGVDADDPNAGDAPQIAPGDLVNWSYTVTNTGNVTVNDIVVTDDQGVPVSCPMDTLEPGQSMVCTASGSADDLLSTGFTTVPGQCGSFPNTPLYENMGAVTGVATTGDIVEDVDASHYCNPQEPSIDIEKATNGVDADDPNAGDAPQIAPGDLVNWSYVVTNTGNTTLTGVAVTDDQGVPVSCPMDTLDPGESMTCTASGFADDLLSTGSTTVPGLCGEFPNTPLYQNMGMATGTSVNGDLVEDTDASHYCNPQTPDIDIEKATNGVDADDPNAGDAPQIMPGELVNWTYLVTNTGNTTLNDVVVTDDQGVPVSCPMDTLEPGESMVCTASGFADDLLTTGATTVIGLCGEFPNTPLYQNMGMATGTSVDGTFVEDVDASHYCNPQEPSIDVEKLTNGVNADDPNAGDAPQIMPGGMVNWTYIVTNTGNTTLNDVIVTDDQGVAVTCPQDTLEPGESMTCSASGFADDLLTTGFTTVPGLCGAFPQTPLYQNMGMATGTSVNGDFVEDIDASHYCNPQEPSIDIEKATNGVDADNPNAGDAPTIAIGNAVSWTYLVTNTGNTTLTNVVVTDDQGVAVSCPQDTLEPGESMTCTANGIADDLDSTGFTTVPGLCAGFPQTPLYQNMGMASGLSVNGGIVNDVDPSHYCNPPMPALDIEKATNGVDADDPNAGDAPVIGIGNVVSWTYLVTNTGDVTLFDVVVTDDQGVAVSCPMDSLLPGQMMTCTASGVADNLDDTAFTTVPGLCGGFPQEPLYRNRGMVSGTTITGLTLTDTDPSHYCNPAAPSITVEKATNGVDADDPNAGDAPQIIPGDTVDWTYLVTNTGDVTLFNVTVGDDQGVIVTCPQDTLQPGESMICTASGTAEDTTSTGFNTVPGVCGGTPNIPLYRNMGMASGDTVTGITVQDNDPSHYCNPPACALTVNKTCLIPMPPASDFMCDKPIDSLTMIWNGSQPVRIKAWKGPVGSTLLADVDDIQPGEEITVMGYAGSPNDVFWEVFVAFTDNKIGESKFHLSCSDDNMDGPEDCGLPQGNGKDDNGGFLNDWILEGMVDASGVLDCTVSTPPGTTSECEYQAFPASCETGDADVLTFVYTGGGCAASDNDQQDHECTGSIDGSAAVTVVDDDGQSYTLQPGEQFSLPRNDAKELTLTNGGGTEVNVLHTSCSQPIQAGDVYGSLTLAQIDGMGIGTQVIYSYEIINSSGVDITDLTAVDMPLGPVPGTPSSLLAGQSVTLMTSAFIAETTTNTVIVDGVGADGQSCNAVDQATVTILPPPPCEVNGEGVLELKDDAIKWKLTNAGAFTATIESLTVSWPSEHGDLIEVKFDGTIFNSNRPAPMTTIGPNDWTGDLKDRQIQPGDEHTLEIKFNENFEGVAGDYQITVNFEEGCSVTFENTGLPFECTKPIDSLTMIYDGAAAPIQVKAWKGEVGSELLADISGIAVGDEVQVNGFAGSPNDVFWEVFSGGTKLGESNFHLSCSDNNMNGAEDCGKRQGNGKDDDSDALNVWILEGMVDADGPFDCTP